MPIFGLDASHHQGVLDFARFRSESGIEFAFLKATEGADFRDADFAGYRDRARAAGTLVAAYHYQRSNATVAAQITNVRSMVPVDTPVILDVEANSGDVGMTRALVDGLRAAGYRVPLSYIPRWYWQQIGSPSLAGLPPLWSSRYPDNTPGPLLSEYASVPTSYWTGYGGLAVAVLQFTSSGRLPGYTGNLDLNAYQGTRAGLQALLLGSTPQEDLVRNLIIAHATGEAQHWVGDGMSRRPIVSPEALAGLRYWIAQYGGNNTAQTIDDLDAVVGLVAEDAPPVTVELDYDRFLNDVVARLSEELKGKLTTTWTAE